MKPNLPSNYRSEATVFRRPRAMRDSSHEGLAPVAVVLAMIAILLGYLPGVQAASTPDDSARDSALLPDLVLPLPGGETMVFRPVFLGIGNAPFALREFVMGERVAASFKEFPTKAAIGGAFLSNRRAHEDWMFFMSKYEVTQGQFDSITHPGKSAGNRFPKVNVSWFEAQDFLLKLNGWVYENDRGLLPTNNECLGFLRLPTEAEWEFAARGGIEVDPLLFERRHPYQNSLIDYEWFSGPASSHDKIRPVGLLKPNPLGLHDMLGNVSEMTASLFQIEYFQGRVGGFTSRGGSFRSLESEMRSAWRMEESVFGHDLQPARRDDLGFRLVISADVFTSMTDSTRLAEAWEHYKGGGRAPVPVQTQAALKLDNPPDQLKRISTTMQMLQMQLAAPTVDSADLENRFELLQTSWTNLMADWHRSLLNSAKAWVQVASYSAQCASELDRSRREKGPSKPRILEQNAPSSASNSEPPLNSWRDSQRISSTPRSINGRKR